MGGGRTDERDRAWPGGGPGDVESLAMAKGLLRQRWLPVGVSMAMGQERMLWG